MTFTKWLTTYAGFTTRSQYEHLLSTLPHDDRKKAEIYYEEQYRYFKMIHPDEKFEQLKLYIE